ncbi:hypothetical protein K5I29_09025 [Flavobacterium agricola]|uniref:Carboxypeptidase-like protein n=1 Tax=Flavobacterium agricola TaxID=2870839 RepID=A0ABY6LZ13_9FLAO|nr:hypothetical protein [Flavobacterium agricola]UYW00675.1 hypothetical protein K5I29_09025 [Flavobacterium agricola]
MKFYFSLFIFFFCLATTFAQKQLQLMGKVTAEQDDLSNITIFNKTQKYEKVTSPGGYFSLKVDLNDSLIFKSEFLYDYVHVVSDQDFETDLLQIRMIKFANMLKEVQIYKALDPVEFGVLAQPAKQYTVAERRLKSASNGPVDFLANSLNGERKMYKTLIGLEKQASVENKLLTLYGRSELITDFNLPEMYLESFSQFACRYNNVLDAVKSNDKNVLRFILIDIARAYKNDFNVK